MEHLSLMKLILDNIYSLLIIAALLVGLLFAYIKSSFVQKHDCEQHRMLMREDAVARAEKIVVEFRGDVRALHDKIDRNNTAMQDEFRDFIKSHYEFFGKIMAVVESLKEKK